MTETECYECSATIIFSHDDTNITCDIIEGQYTETLAINCPHCGVENTIG